MFVYSSVSGSWTLGTSILWSALGLDTGDEPIWPWYTSAYGCLYWDVSCSNQVIKFDINSMEFSTVRLLSDYELRSTKVVEAREGRIRMFSLIYSSENSLALHYPIRQNDSENATERPVDTTIPLPTEYKMYHLAAAAHGYIFLIGQQNEPRLRAAFLSLEIKTLKIERVCLFSGPRKIIPYFGFPPLVSATRI